MEEKKLLEEQKEIHKKELLNIDTRCSEIDKDIASNSKSVNGIILGSAKEYISLQQLNPVSVF